MFERVYPRSQPHRPVLPAPVVASLAFHALLVGAAGGTVPVYVSESITEGIQYFAPLPVRRTDLPGERVAYLEVAGGDVGRALGTLDAFGEGISAQTRGRDGADSTDGAETPGAAPVPEFAEIKLDSVYFPDEVDNPAAYDPRSRAPAYPDSLQKLGIEGSVTAQFVVDTTGHAADSTLLILDFTHEAFARSVREALSGMIFRPAEIRGARIQQLVQQTFSFRMPGKSADSTGATRSRATAGGLPP